MGFNKYSSNPSLKENTERLKDSHGSWGDGSLPAGILAQPIMQKLRKVMPRRFRKITVEVIS
jgi:hypothetical protein